MEMSQISSLVGRLTDEQLMEEMQRPSGMAPLHVVVAELQKRAAMRGGQPKGFADGGSVESSRAAQIRQQIEALGIPGYRYTSGYRTPERNREVGGVANSWHTKGEAIDFVAPGETLASVRQRIAAANMPIGELLYHNAGSGNHFHYSASGRGNRGQARSQEAPPNGAASDPSTPAAAPPPNINDIFQGGGSVARQLMAEMGIPDGAQDLGASMQEMRGLVRDPSEAFGPAIKDMQQERAQEERANRGRTFMEAGLAMMQAQTPNFMSALGAGGTAGLAARDRIATADRGLMQGVVQAQLAQSQAGAAQDNVLMQAAAGQRRAEQGMVGQAWQSGIGAATAASGQVLDRERMAQNDRQFSADMGYKREALAQQGADADANRAAQMQIAELQAGTKTPDVASLSIPEARNVLIPHYYRMLSPRIGEEISRGVVFTARMAEAEAQRMTERQIRAAKGLTVGATTQGSSAVPSGFSVSGYIPPATD